MDDADTSKDKEIESMKKIRASLEKDLKYKSERIVALDESNRNLTAKVVEVQKQRDEMKDGFNKEIASLKDLQTDLKAQLKTQADHSKTTEEEIASLKDLKTDMEGQLKIQLDHSKAVEEDNEKLTLKLTASEKICDDLKVKQKSLEEKVASLQLEIESLHATKTNQETEYNTRLTVLGKSLTNVHRNERQKFSLVLQNKNKEIIELKKGLNKDESHGGSAKQSADEVVPQFETQDTLTYDGAAIICESQLVGAANFASQLR